jgi:hypothetical protein
VPRAQLAERVDGVEVRIDADRGYEAGGDRFLDAVVEAGREAIPVGIDDESPL